jgi:hypothetical protein
MKNLTKTIVIAATILIAVTVFLFGCIKENLTTTQDETTSLTSRRVVDYTNPNPTWIQITSPILRPAIWGTKWVPVGYTAGLPGPYNTTQKFQIYDTTVVIKWHLHVGLRNFNAQLKPDVIDYRFFYINGDGEKFKKTIPNGGVMGDYDFIDTIKIDNWGYYNSMYDPRMGNGDSTNLLYDWNGITPEIHSSATNGWLGDALMTKFLRP